MVRATEGVADQLEREHRQVGRERMKAARAVLAVAAEGRAVVPVVVVVLVAGVPRFMSPLGRILLGPGVLVGEGPMGSVPRGAALVAQLQAPRGEGREQHQHEARREAKHRPGEAESAEVSHEAATLARKRRGQASRERFSIVSPQGTRPLKRPSRESASLRP